MKIRVRNIMGITRADLEVDGIALIAGLNYAGKSSLLEAVSCAMTGDFRLRDADKKNLLEGIIQEGEKDGMVQVGTNAGMCRITFPDGKVFTDGDFNDVHHIVAGRTRFADLSRPQQITFLNSIKEAEPDKSDLEKELTEIINQDAIDLLWERIKTSGWDKAMDAAKEHGTKLRGRWEDITNIRFGSKKAESWHPNDIDPYDPGDPEKAEEAVKAAEAALQEAVKHTAISKHDVERLKADVARVPELEKSIASIDEEVENLNTQMEELVQERNEMVDPVDTSTLPKCPHCNKPIMHKNVGTTTSPHFEITAPPHRSNLGKEKIKELRQAIAKQDGAIANIEHQVRDAAQRRHDLAADMKRCRESENKLHEYEEAGPVDEGAVEKAEADLEKAKQFRDDLNKFMEARKLSRQISNNQHVVNVLDPRGLRQKKLSEALTYINDYINDKADTLGIGRNVELTQEGGVYLSGRPYKRLAESERWLIDLCIQIVAAEAQGAPMILVDRLDVLVPDRRVKVLKTIKQAQLHAIIAMSAKAPEAVPGLRKSGFGASYWLEAGEIEGID